MKNILCFLLLVICTSAFSETVEISKTQMLNKTNESLISYLEENLENIVGIEYIAVGGTSESIASRFGHSLLRFIDSDSNYTNDIVVNFAAWTEDVTYEIRKGLMGDYPVFAELNFLTVFWDRYVALEDRPLERFIIPSTKDQRKLLVKNLKKFVNKPSALGQYTFLNNNCSKVLAKVLIESGFPHVWAGISGRVPVLFDNWLEDSMLSPYLSIKSYSPASIFKEAKKILKIPSGRKINDYQYWIVENVTELTKKMSKQKLLFLYQQLKDLPIEFAKLIIQNANYKTEEISYLTTIGMKQIPNAFYSPCIDEECAKEVLNFEKTYLGSK